LFLQGSREKELAMSRCFLIALAATVALALSAGGATAQTASVKLDANALALQSTTGFFDQLNVGATVECPGAITPSLGVQVTQQRPDGSTASGFGAAFVPCGGTRSVNVRVTTFDVGAFALGKASAQAALFSGFFVVATDEREIDIRLR
jgi:hypothetical protein